MKRLVFPKVFVRHAEEDFVDDGTKFRLYYYKDVLPISATNGKYGAFVCIRMDYLGINYEAYKEDYKILDEFNGCEEVDMKKLIENCEFICEKYNLRGDLK